MENEKTWRRAGSVMVQMMKRNWFLGLLIVVVASALIFVFFPRDLEKHLALDGISADEISSMGMIVTTYYQPDGPVPVRMELIEEPEVTDEAFIEDVLSALSAHTMRRSLNLGGHYHFPINLEKPQSVDVSIRFEEPGKYAYISILGDARTVMLRAHDRNNPKGDLETYVLYGDGIDTVRLTEMVERLQAH